MRTLGKEGTGMCKKTLSALAKLLCALAALFAVTFAVYFFNLDMKLTSKLEPFLLKIYDRLDRNTQL